MRTRVAGRHNDLSYVHGSVKGKTRTEAMMMIKHGRFQGVEHKVVGQVAYRGTGATPRVSSDSSSYITQRSLMMMMMMRVSTGDGAFSAHRAVGRHLDRAGRVQP